MKEYKTLRHLEIYNRNVFDSSLEIHYRKRVETAEMTLGYIRFMELTAVAKKQKH